MADKKTKPRGLGRGLSALMADVAPAAEADTGQSAKTPDLMLPIEQLVANPDQPRRHFAKEALDELAASISEKGIIQPLIVRPVAGGQYEIVAGERRWRAAQMARLHEVPALIRELDDTQVLELAIIENIQRADLNAIEEAAGYRQLMDRFGHTQEKLAEALGKSRSHIANLLRLLNLPDDVQRLLQDGELSTGHARALITAPNPSELARIVLQKRLSVRETEALAKKAQNPGVGTGAKTSPAPQPDKDADTRALEGDLSANLGMKVSIDHQADTEKGILRIQYGSLDQLDTLCRMLSTT